MKQNGSLRFLKNRYTISMTIPGRVYVINTNAPWYADIPSPSASSDWTNPMAAAAKGKGTSCLPMMRKAREKPIAALPPGMRKKSVRVFVSGDTMDLANRPNVRQMAMKASCRVDILLTDTLTLSNHAPD